jgi:galactonate dehydratase
MPNLVAIETVEVDCGPRQKWLLVRLEGEDGIVGLGEASDSGSSPVAAGAIHDLFAPRLLGRPADPVRVREELRYHGSSPPTGTVAGLTLMTAVSALEMAAWDLAARRLAVPLATMLGGPLVDEVPLYANINRGLPDMKAETFAKAAVAAAEAGFPSVKCAPFAGVRALHTDGASMEDGIRRVAAVREALPEGTALMVDAHGRFDRITGPWVACALEPFEPTWLEEPSRFEDDPGTLAATAAATRVPLAAGELMAGLPAYLAMVEAGSVSVVMTDVTHNGGVAATIAVGALVRGFGLPLSLHSPSGPVATAVSAHLAAAMAGVASLEYPFSRQRDETVAALLGAPEPVTAGRYHLTNKPGIGIELDERELRRVGQLRRTAV